MYDGVKFLVFIKNYVYSKTIFFTNILVILMGNTRDADFDSPILLIGALIFRFCFFLQQSQSKTKSRKSSLNDNVVNYYITGNTQCHAASEIGENARERRFLLKKYSIKRIKNKVSSQYACALLLLLINRIICRKKKTKSREKRLITQGDLRNGQWLRRKKVQGKSDSLMRSPRSKIRRGKEEEDDAGRRVEDTGEAANTRWNKIENKRVNRDETVERPACAPVY